MNCIGFFEAPSRRPAPPHGKPPIDRLYYGAPVMNLSLTVLMAVSAWAGEAPVAEAPEKSGVVEAVEAALGAAGPNADGARPRQAPEPEAGTQRLRPLETHVKMVDVDETCGGLQGASFKAPEVMILRYHPPRPRPKDPLIFDLHGDGVRTSRQKVRFDLDGDGSLEQVNDISPGDGLLIFDADGNGRSGENGKEVFGDASDVNGDGKGDGLADGFEALNALARRAVSRGLLAEAALKDGRLDSKELGVLEESFGLAVKQGSFGGRKISLAKARIAGVELADWPSERTKNFDNQGNDLSRRRGAMFLRTDGSKGTYSTMWLSAEAVAGKACPPAPAQK